MLCVAIYTTDSPFPSFTRSVKSLLAFTQNIYLFILFTYFLIYYVFIHSFIDCQIFHFSFHGVATLTAPEMLPLA